MVAAANAEIASLNVAEARGLLGDDGVVFVDLRDPANSSAKAIFPVPFIARAAC